MLPTEFAKWKSSHTKTALRYCPSGSYFVPIAMGKEMFTPFRIKKINGLSYHVVRVHDNKEFTFKWTEQVVKAAPPEALKPIRVIDLDVLEGFAQKWGYRERRKVITWNTPIILTYQEGDVFGDFEEMPYTAPMDSCYNSEEASLERNKWAEFTDKCPSYECDFADFLEWEWQQGTIYDYSEEKKGGLVTIDSPTFEDENTGSRRGYGYGTFEEYHETLTMEDFAEFLTFKLNQK